MAQPLLIFAGATLLGTMLIACDGADLGDSSSSVSSSSTSAYLQPDYTKLDAFGNALEEDASEWSCVRENTMGRVWEVKTSDGGVHDAGHTFSWYSPNIEDENKGVENAGVCADPSNCDTEKYVSQVNAMSLCGFNDWRLPIYGELLFIKHGVIFPFLTNVNEYFPSTSNNSDNGYWSAEGAAIAYLLPISYDPFIIYPMRPEDRRAVRLVRVDN